MAIPQLQYAFPHAIEQFVATGVEWMDKEVSTGVSPCNDAMKNSY